MIILQKAPTLMTLLNSSCVQIPVGIWRLVFLWVFYKPSKMLAHPFMCYLSPRDLKRKLRVCSVLNLNYHPSMLWCDKFSKEWKGTVVLKGNMSVYTSPMNRLLIFIHSFISLLQAFQFFFTVLSESYWKDEEIFIAYENVTWQNATPCGKSRRS